MANPVAPFTPWSGGLHIRQHPSLAPANKLLIADDVVYDFDGTKQKRGGQSHRNRNPIMGGRIDDHFTKAPPGDWDIGSADFALVHNDDSVWQGATTSSGVSTDFRKGYVDRLPAAFTLRARVMTADVVTSGTYFRVSIDPGTDDGLYRLGVQFSGEGIKLETSDGTFTAITSSNGEWIEFNMDALSGRELFETNKFHNWRFDITESQQVLIYFDELHIWTSNDGLITTLGEAGTQAQAEMEWVSADRIDLSIDFMAASVVGGEESIVTCLADYPRLASGIISPTVHRMPAIVNGRVFLDQGNHRYDLILDNYAGITVTPRTICDFASYNTFLIIARTGSRLYKWDGTFTLAQEIEDSPFGSMLRVHADRLWVAGDHRNPSRIYFSGLLNEDVWTTEGGGDFLDSGFIDVDPEDGGIISGIGPSFHGDLIVYKTTGIYRITGFSIEDFVMETLTKALGGASHHAIQNVGNDQYFVSTFGVHSLLTTQKFGDLESAFLSHDIRDLWNSSINPSYLQFSWAYNNEPLDRYELLISTGIDQHDTGIFPNRVFVLHYGVQSDSQPVGSWSVKRIGGGSAIMYTDEDGIRHGFVGGDDGFVNRQDERYTHDFPVYRATATSASTETQNLFIMRHMAGDEIFGWEDLPYFDGVIYNLQYDDADQISQLGSLVSSGRRWWRYYSVFDYPYSGTLFGGTGLGPGAASWFNYLRNNIQFAGSTSHRRYRVADTVALFNAFTGPDGQKREIIPWGLISAVERAAIIVQMANMADLPGGVSVTSSGVFLDQSWLSVPDFFVEDTLSDASGHGNVKEGSPKLTALNYAGVNAAFGDAGTWLTHGTAIYNFYTELDAALAVQGKYAIKNGEHRTVNALLIPKPWMLENAWNSNIDGGPDPGGIPWTTAKSHFDTDPRNLISIVCSAAANSTVGVPEALAHWESQGGWISFTDDGSAAGIANRELAYADAAAILATHGWPADEGQGFV